MKEPLLKNYSENKRGTSCAALTFKASATGNSNASQQLPIESRRRESTDLRLSAGTWCVANILLLLSVACGAADFSDVLYSCLHYCPHCSTN